MLSGVWESGTKVAPPGGRLTVRSGPLGPLREDKRVLKRLWSGWLCVARTLGYVQSLLILTLVYFVVIAPFALAVRFFLDPLCLRRAPSWHSLPQEGRSPPTLNSVRQQF